MSLKVAILGVLVVLLLVVSSVQAFQLMQLKEKITELDASAAASSSGPKVNLQTSLNNLPSMVGGC